MVLGYQGSYDRVTTFVRKWRQDQHETSKTIGRGAFVLQTFAPGEAFQFDWSEDWAVSVAREQSYKLLSSSWRTAEHFY